MELINKLHEMYRNDRVSSDILNVIEKYLQRINSCVSDIERQRLLNFTTWFLDRIESEFGIAVVDDDYLKRCEAVKIKLFTQNKVSLQGVEVICKKYAERADIYYYATEYRLNVVIGGITENNLLKMQNELRQYVPAHILLDYNDYIRTHEEMEDFTHEYLENYNHEEIISKSQI